MIWLFLPVVGVFLATALNAQPLASWEYRQFLKTAHTRLQSSGSTTAVNWNFSWVSAVNRTSDLQIRDEITAAITHQFPISDAWFLSTSLEGITLVSDQAGAIFRSNDWKPLTGAGFSGYDQRSVVQAGAWVVTQNAFGAVGPALRMNHESRPMAADRVALDLKADVFSGTADRRVLGKQNWTVSIVDPQEQSYQVRYTRSVNNRDFLTATSTDRYLLDKRLEVTDGLIAGLRLPVFLADFIVNLDGTWQQRSVDRQSELAGPVNPDYQVLAGESGTQVGLSWRSGSWQVELQTAVAAGSDSYRLLETPGLDGLNIDIQKTRIQKRNTETTSVKVSQQTVYAGNNWSWKQSILVSRDQLFNPNNAKLDDRDAGTIGLAQELTVGDGQWNGTIQADYQQTHQVFIHRDRSGDNHRNHFLRLAWTGQNRYDTWLLNAMAASISSQIRQFDYDELFLTPKSFVLRNLVISDSVSIGVSSAGSVVLRGVWTETHQGQFNPDRFTEKPSRRLWGRFLEGGWVHRSGFIAAYRWYQQDQDRWRLNRWNLIQTIIQQGPVLRWQLSDGSLSLIADAWLMNQQVSGEDPAWFPTVTVQVRSLF